MQDIIFVLGHMSGGEFALMLFSATGIIICLFWIAIQGWDELVCRLSHRRHVKATLSAVIHELPSLRRELVEMQKTMRGDPLTTLVKFFNATSPWHDRGLDKLLSDLQNGSEEQKRFAEGFDTLVTHFKRAGRGAMNRTEKGELVTKRNVYLGGIYGLFTHPITFWESVKDNEKGGWGWSDPYFKTRNSHDVVCDYAYNFMFTHVDPMIDMIDEILCEARPLRLVA